VLGEKKILVLIVYTAKTKIEFKELELKLKEALERLSNTVAEK
jgi:hypothetical protein